MLGMGFIRFSKVVSGTAAERKGRLLEDYPEIKNAGRIELKDGFVLYNSEPAGSWRIQLSDVKVVGEYSTGCGRLGRDWFLVFVTGLDSEPYLASMHAKNMREIRTNIARSLDNESWEFKPSQKRFSRVIWPTSVLDQPLFDFDADDFFLKFLKRTGVGKFELNYSASVRRFLTISKEEGGVNESW